MLSLGNNGDSQQIRVLNLTHEVLQTFCASLLANSAKVDAPSSNSTADVDDSIDTLVARLRNQRSVPEPTKNFKNMDFVVVHLLLRTALHEHLSTEAPNPKASDQHLLCLYDGQVLDYRNDNINWEHSKMNIKIIVYCPDSNSYRLKNKRDESGVPVMRRQTWAGEKDGVEWKKHEYKLFSRVTFYFRGNAVAPSSGPPSLADNALSSKDSLELRQFPVLVHYFRSSAPSALTEKKNTRKSGAAADLSESVDDGSTSTAPVSSSRKRRSRMSKKQEIAEAASTHINLLNQHNFVTTVVTNSVASSSNNSNAQILTRSTSPTKGLSPSVPIPPPFLESFEVPLPSPPFAVDLNDIPIISSPSQLVHLEAAIASSLYEVLSFSPDCAPADEPSRVLVICRFPSELRGSSFVAVFGEVEVAVKQLEDHVFEFYSPRCIAGIREFFIACRANHNATGLNANLLPQLSSSNPHWLAMRHLCLSNLELETNESIRSRLSRFRHATRELDLAYNNLSNIDFLGAFHRLKTLIIDNNKISCNTAFPSLPKLQTLFVNSNLISSLEKFLDHVCVAFPNLKYLSMLDNEANPFQRARHHYYNYRIYVISRLKRLTQLDSALVSDEERYHAASISQSDETK